MLVYWLSRRAGLPFPESGGRALIGGFVFGEENRFLDLGLVCGRNWGDARHLDHLPLFGQTIAVLAERLGHTGNDRALTPAVTATGAAHIAAGGSGLASSEVPVTITDSGNALALTIVGDQAVSLGRGVELVLGTLDKLGDAFSRNDLSPSECLIIDEAYQVDSSRYHRAADLANVHLLVGDAPDTVVAGDRIDGGQRVRRVAGTEHQHGHDTDREQCEQPEANCPSPSPLPLHPSSPSR